MLLSVAVWLCWGRLGVCCSAGPSVGPESSSREEVRFLITPAVWNTFFQVLAGVSYSAVVTRGLEGWAPTWAQNALSLLWLLEQRGKGTTLHDGVESSLMGLHKGFADAGRFAYVQVQNGQGRHCSCGFLTLCTWMEREYWHLDPHVSDVPDMAWWMQECEKCCSA